LTGTQLAIKVAERAPVHDFSSSGGRTEILKQVMPTGKSAAQLVSDDLADSAIHIEGYLRPEELSRVITTFFLTPEASGGDVIIREAHFAPLIELGAVPPAVVAADLATSTDARERAAGIRALDEMRTTWLESHTR
jgi:hypothetical protein